VARKVYGGNRTTRCAHTQEVLTNVLRTIQQRRLDASEVLSGVVRNPTPITALAPPLQVQ